VKSVLSKKKGVLRDVEKFFKKFIVVSKISSIFVANFALKFKVKGYDANDDTQKYHSGTHCLQRQGGQ